MNSGRDNIAAYGTNKIENGNTRSAMQENWKIH